MIRRWATLLVLTLPLGVGASSTQGAALIADLSSHLVAITTGFTGADVLLFGTIDGEPGDVAVVIRGPEETVTVRRKEQVAGLWLNGRNLTFRNVPAFYAVATTRPLEEMAGASTLARHQIGADNLRIEPPARATEAEVREFLDALLRVKGQQDLYPTAPGRVSMLGGRLFRTPVAFPSNVPTGSYIVEIFLFRDGNVVSAQTTPLIVSKVGTEAEIYDFAHRFAVLYGVIAVIVALLAGWGAGWIFRKI